MFLSPKKRVTVKLWPIPRFHPSEIKHRCVTGRLYLLHLTGSVVVGRHAAAFLSDLHGSGLQQTISDRPLGHVASSIAPDLDLETTSYIYPPSSTMCWC